MTLPTEEFNKIFSSNQKYYFNFCMVSLFEYINVNVKDRKGDPNEKI